MSTQFDRPAESETRAAPRLTTGTALREARLRRGLTVTEVAADTRINSAYLEAMEVERWELLPAPVYARGFLRSYARYLRFDEDAIERMVPRNLPRPRDLEPAAGLRRSASQPALALPSFGWLRREARLPVADREHRPPSATTSRATQSARPRTFASTSGPGAGGAAARTSARLRAFLAMSRGTAQEFWGRLIALPRGPLTAGGATLLAVLAVAYLWAGRDADPVLTPRPTAVSSAASTRQVAGPEPVSSAVVAPTTAPPVTAPRDGGMPDLVGMPRRDAEDELERLELAFVVIEVTTPAAAPGTVYNQSPQPGKDVRRGDSVTLLVARAP